MTNDSALAFIIRESHISEKPHSYYRDSSDSLRRNILEQDMARPTKNPRFLLVDDDPILCRIMKKAATTLGIELTYLSTLDKLSQLTKDTYDVAMLDYDLGFINGYEVASYLEQKMPEMPVVMISHFNNLNPEKWPWSIREFIHKRLGPFAILEAAIEAYDVNHVHQGLRSNQSPHKKRHFRDERYRRRLPAKA